MPSENPAHKQSNDVNEVQSEITVLSRAINALSEKIAGLTPPASSTTPLAETLLQANAFVFDAAANMLHPVEKVSTPPLSLLYGIDRAKNALLENTQQFAKGFSANNALLWGARGMGKSTLIKSVHYELCSDTASIPALIEIHREDISSLPTLLRGLSKTGRRCILFCDDLSFNRPDQDFKALKSVLEGGLEGRPSNILFYATSNRRHLLPRQMADQEAATGIHPNESMDETIALSDRFGLWLGFHACDQKEYLSMVDSYINAFSLSAPPNWSADALEWAKTRGNRSGRTAWQFAQHLAGTLGKSISF